MAYNLTNITNATNPGALVEAINVASGGLFFALLLGVAWFALFSYLKAYETVDAFMVSSFITTVIGGLMFFAGWISWGLAVLPVVLLITAFIVNFFK